MGVIRLPKEILNKLRIKRVHSEFLVTTVLFMPHPHNARVKIENTASFLRLGLKSAQIWTEILHRKRTFRKRSSNWRRWKTPALRFSEIGKHFENGAFESDDVMIKTS